MGSHSSFQGIAWPEDVQNWRTSRDFYRWTIQCPAKVRFLPRITQWISCRTRCWAACKSSCCPLLPLGQLLATWYLDSPYILTLNQSLPLDLTLLGLNFFCGLTPSLPSQLPFSGNLWITFSFCSAPRALCLLSLDSGLSLCLCLAVCWAPGGLWLGQCRGTHGWVSRGLTLQQPLSVLTRKWSYCSSNQLLCSYCKPGTELSFIFTISNPHKLLKDSIITLVILCSGGRTGVARAMC